MSDLRLLPIPAFADNYIWLLADANGRCLIVDPGDGAPALTALARQHYTPSAILLTHHHADHIGGVPALRERYPDIAVIAPSDDRIPYATRRVGQGQQVLFDAPAIAFDVLEIPGHTRSHIAFYGGGLLFCGDTLFSVGCGRMFEGTPAQMLASLDRLAVLPGDTQVCCGHEYTLANCAFALTVDAGNTVLAMRLAEVRSRRARGEPTLPTRIADERATNPFLRVDAPALRDAAAHACGPAAADRVARFAWLRQTKDQFRGPTA